jgi:hypothetical protein
VGLEQSADRVEERLLLRAHRLAKHHADPRVATERPRVEIAEAVRDLTGHHLALAVGRDHDLDHRAGGQRR